MNTSLVCWEGDNVRLVLTHKDSKGLTKALVGEVSSCLKKIGCRCVLDEQVRNQCRSKLLNIQCVNRFEPLVSQACDSDELMECLSGDEHVHSGLDVQLVGDRVRALGGSVTDRRLRVATWNFSGLGSEHKQKEIGEVLDKNSIDVVEGQESWKRRILK